MTDKEKIRAFVEGRRKENWEKRYNNSGGDLFWDRANEDDEILSFIDSMPKLKFKVGDRIRKISIDDITGLKIKSICSDHFLCEHNIPVYFTELEDWELVEEPVGEELEEEALVYGATGEISSEGKAIINKDIYEAFKAGAQWQKQQMIKDAVNAKVTARWPLHSSPLYNSYEIYVPYAQHLSEGDKVKLIVIKEE